MEPNFDDSKQILKLIIEKGELPRYIYKYTSVETALLIINNSKLKFSKPSEFNDPFDCNLTIDTDNTEEEISNYIEFLRKRYNLSEAEIAIIKPKLHDPEERSKETNNAIKETKEIFGVSCFSKNKNNLLMWAHYSDKHRGVCMKFDILADPDFFMTPFPILYKNDYPKYNYFRFREGLAKFLLETKSHDWEYEQEIRIMKQGPDLYKFKKEVLVEIIFGVRTTHNDRKSIIEAEAENSYNNIKYRYCLISDSKFELKFS